MRLAGPLTLVKLEQLGRVAQQRVLHPLDQVTRLGRRFFRLGPIFHQRAEVVGRFHILQQLGRVFIFFQLDQANVDQPGLFVLLPVGRVVGFQVDRGRFEFRQFSFEEPAGQHVVGHRPLRLDVLVLAIDFEIPGAAAEHFYLHQFVQHVLPNPRLGEALEHGLALGHIARGTLYGQHIVDLLLDQPVQIGLGQFLFAQRGQHLSAGLDVCAYRDASR